MVEARRGGGSWHPFAEFAGAAGAAIVMLEYLPKSMRHDGFIASLNAF
jgi:hypothetical protein